MKVKHIAAEGGPGGLGEHAIIKLSNDRVVIVWDEHVDDADIGVVEIHRSMNDVKAGNQPEKSYIV